jgi:predicted ATPase
MTPTRKTTAKTRTAVAHEPPTAPASSVKLMKAVTFKASYRCFEKGRSVTLRPGVNLLVGDQGCGKSSLLSLLRDYWAPESRMLTARSRKEARATIKVSTDAPVGRFSVGFVDFENDNPRTLSYFGDDALFQVASKFRSHGQTVLSQLKGIAAALTNVDPDDDLRRTVVLLLDEPDMALSPRSAFELARTFEQLVASGHQVIASVHNPIVIGSQDEVLSLEHGKWMTSAAFLNAHELEQAHEPAGEHSPRLRTIKPS